MNPTLDDAQAARTINPYPLTWHPSSEEDWDIADLVEKMRINLPQKQKTAVANFKPSALKKGAALAWEQDVLQSDSATKAMSMEYTSRLFDTPFESFQRRLPPADWGMHLKGWLGGEAIISQRDEAGRAVRQVERMVLTMLANDKLGLKMSTPFNMDMTKVELFKYSADMVTVYWNVRFSDNGSTEADIGCVEFRKYDEGSTLVTFHSGHLLKTPWGYSLPHGPVRIMLKKAFLDHLEHYHCLLNA